MRSPRGPKLQDPNGVRFTRPGWTRSKNPSMSAQAVIMTGRDGDCGLIRCSFLRICDRQNRDFGCLCRGDLSDDGSPDFFAVAAEFGECRNKGADGDRRRGCEALEGASAYQVVKRGEVKAVRAVDQGQVFGVPIGVASSGCWRGIRASMLMRCTGRSRRLPSFVARTPRRAI